MHDNDDDDDDDEEDKCTVWLFLIQLMIFMKNCNLIFNDALDLAHMTRLSLFLSLSLSLSFCVSKCTG
jgi:hypothetical protein